VDAELAALLDAEITNLRRLSGGASRETWSLDADGRGLILQRQRPGSTGANLTMALEVCLLRAAAAAGVRVPEVVADASDGAALGAPAFVVSRLEGETIARKLLRDDQFAAVRPRVAGECGALLAAIHRVPVDAVPGLAASDPIESMRGTLDTLGEPHPAFELGLRWLEQRRPAAATRTVVHGDFRTGNLMISPQRVEAILDWELAHLGDPLEDLGWFCVRAWRFGADDRPAGGFGSREELWAAYEAAGGAPVDPDAARWWEVWGTLRWGVICIAQAASHRLGLSRSVELAAIGRRTCENEHDVLALLAPDRSAPSPTAAPTDGGGGFAPHDGPTAAELADAVREWLEGDVAGATEGRVRFHTRVAANVMGMLERELRLGPDQATSHRDRLARLGAADDAALAAAIRSGAYDDRWDEVVAEVWAAVVDKLEVAHPGYAAGRP
jgi:aminoglycoside phosphotransferase (APT) family kinase protein